MRYGRLTVVGMGPGDACLMAPLARAAIEGADVVAGYTAYLDLLPPELLEGKTLVASGMMGEIDRCKAAVESARSGLDTVVVSSGDAGVYGMAGLVLEILEAEGLVETLPWQVVPGIPALAAAAALLGAPLTHDFAVVSLSDLLTDWELIERRITAAVSADFVLVLYNPRSKRRDWQLPRALELARARLSPDTPVGIVKNAYREGQKAAVVRLADVDPARVDMLTILVIGQSTTRVAGPAMLTPRGYAGKYARRLLPDGGGPAFGPGDAT